MKKRTIAILPASLLIAMGLPMPAHAATPWQQGFERNTDGWFENGDTARIKRVASGDAGIESASGDNHAVMTGAGMFTRFGSYSAEWDGSWSAEVDVHLDPAWEAGAGFEYSVAANGSDDQHQRDYIFHVTKDTSAGALLVGASNNTNFAPREDLETLDNHGEITDAGWYTLRHTFRNDGGVLAVDLEVIDRLGHVVFSETRRSDADTIDQVGGNRYGWFTALAGTDLAIDDVELSRPEQEPGSSYRTDFSHAAITKANTARWRMSGPFDAAIETIDGDGVLRLSNARTSGSLGDMLFAPELTVAATEAVGHNAFSAEFTVEPTEYQKGLSVTVSPDDGSGGRNGYLRISHAQDETMTVEALEWFTPTGDLEDLEFAYVPVATGLALDEAHTIQMQVVKWPSAAPEELNDVFRARVDAGQWFEGGTFEAYYAAGGEANHPTNTLLFRLNGPAAPDLEGKGLLIDDLSMAVSSVKPVEPVEPPVTPPTDPGTPPTTPGNPDPGTPPVTTPAKKVSVKAKPRSARSKMYVNVNPNRGSGSWKFKVQKRTDSGWRTLKKTYRTKGNAERLTINLPKGTYRAKVQAQHGYEKGYSARVTLVR